MELEAVLFDLDGVITDTAEFHYIAWKQMAEQIGITIDREFNERLKGISRMESLERILIHGGVSDQYTKEQKEELAHSKNEHYVSLLVNLTAQDVYPGIKELLVSLREKQIPAVIASASKNAPQILHALGIMELLSHIVSPEGIPGKPAPAIFLQGAEAVGANAANCIGIEDAQAGIEAIKSAGMFAVGIGQSDVLLQSGADVVYSNTKELELEKLYALYMDAHK